MKFAGCVFLAFLVSGRTIPTKLNPLSSQMQVKLDDAQIALVDGSKQAIIAAGISEPYFNSHFTLVNVFNQPSDRRVIWKFVVNGYEAIINDSIGFTSVGAVKTDIHSVSRNLGRLTEIRKTVTRSHALHALNRCIGSYSEAYVEFGQINGRSELFLVGTQTPGVNRHEPAMGREREEAEKRSDVSSGTDVIENEDGEKQKSPVTIGYINLQTGKCTTGKGVLAKESW